MKVELRTIYFERLPEISMRISAEPLLCLQKLAEIARADGSLEVRTTFDGDGVHHCNVTSFAWREEHEHEGLFAMFVHWNRDGASLRLQVAARRWNPDPPTYDAYVAAARRLFLPIIAEYNRRHGTRHRMRIQSKDDLQPKLTPAAKKAFDHFVARANKSALHPQDWEDFYYFVYVCRKTRLALSLDEVRWFCRRAGFPSEYSQVLSVAFHHCTEFLNWYRRSVRR